MDKKEQIIKILKEFEQTDYKRGGVSLAPEMYNAVADKLVKLFAIPVVSNSVCTCGSLNYGYGFAKCYDCGKIKNV